ncbi:sulfite exporter TauE/SafE family protein [Rubinisphaera margarita]|uniref:sulfite exporter TauE/SafE family protein n=1 Tax=Rubinisphaera margarita TaxID=2909586 RepID=UPI001EE7D476|nr:sulfite exporter TauE/SafE family protein [Rubinisphaera margarita]MCG6156427.1 sulfite exporter TauE/SafE family protein [Rubinisphaera margarita]
MRSATGRFPYLWPFLVWLGIFYTAWLTLVIAGGSIDTLRSHWPIAVAMSFGSYIAGSTPMGGGTVGFPVLVLLFDFPGSLGRNFGLAVQSIGMVSASIYIFSAGIKLNWGILRPAMVGSLIGTPLGALFVAPHVPDLWVKLLFAIVWASFGIMHLVKLRELVAAAGMSSRWRSWENAIGLAVGLSGGVVASITGVGIDMMIYAMLVLLFRADLKTAIPTSVVLMAFTSVIGIASNVGLARLMPGSFAIAPEVFANWLAAAPIVALGAPLGAVVVNLISRTPTLVLVSVLCIGQFVWTIVSEEVSGGTLVASVLAVLGMNGIFHLLYVSGSEQQPEPAGVARPTLAEQGES